MIITSGTTNRRNINSFMIFFPYDLHYIIHILLCSQEKCVQVKFYDASAEQMIQIHKM